MMRTIEITGSSGKGAVVNYVAQIWRELGTHRVGTFIPRPHGRWPFEEICSVDGSQLTVYLRSAAPVYQRLQENGATFSIIEGAYPPELRSGSVATAITMICDDTDQPALQRAALKAAVMCRADVPIVVGRCPPDCAALIERTAHQQGARLMWAHEDVDARITNFDDGRPTIDVRTAKATYHTRLQLRGRYQLDNAVIAIRIAELFDIPAETVCIGLQGAEPLGARLHYVQHGTQTILVDFLKNPRGAELLADYLTECHPGISIAVRLKGYQPDVRAILERVGGPVTFGDAIPDAPLVCVAGPYVSDLITNP
jgi:folylpolyglutamate synthase/dihydropteroate synthase